MIKKFFISLISFLLIIQSSVVDTSFAITAEERLEEVEKQLIAVANQIKQYEGEKTDLEKAILANDAAIIKFSVAPTDIFENLIFEPFNPFGACACT